MPPPETEETLHRISTENSNTLDFDLLIQPSSPMSREIYQISNSSVRTNEELRITGENLRENIVFALIVLARAIRGPKRSAWKRALADDGALYCIWKVLYACPDIKAAFYIEFILTSLAQEGTEGTVCPKKKIQFGLEHSTPDLFFSANNLQIRNDSWTVESARSGAPVPTTGKWFFEVLLLTSEGGIQVGWTVENWEVVPEKMVGIGECMKSSSFDGKQCRVPCDAGNDASITRNIGGVIQNYGNGLKMGDVVGCFFDADMGAISYSVNGEWFGYSVSKVGEYGGAGRWYAALSVPPGQQVQLNFGKDGSWCAVPKDYRGLHDVSEDEHLSDLVITTRGFNESCGVCNILHTPPPVPHLYFEVSCLYLEAGTQVGFRSALGDVLSLIIDHQKQVLMRGICLGRIESFNRTLGVGFISSAFQWTVNEAEEDCTENSIVFLTLDGKVYGLLYFEKLVLTVFFLYALTLYQEIVL